MAGIDTTLMPGQSPKDGSAHQTPSRPPLLRRKATYNMSAFIKRTLERDLEITSAPPLPQEAEDPSHSARLSLIRTSSDTIVVSQPSPRVEEIRSSESPQQDLTNLAVWRKWSIFVCSCLLQFLLNLDMAAVAVTLPVYRRPLCSHPLRRQNGD